LELAKLIFKDTEIKITASGQRHLGAAIGDHDFKTSYVNEKVSAWIKEIAVLAEDSEIPPSIGLLCIYSWLSPQV
jgi:hypothetical protein